jgi:hypothetical protein
MDWLVTRAEELNGNLSAPLRQTITDARFICDGPGVESRRQRMSVSGRVLDSTQPTSEFTAADGGWVRASPLERAFVLSPRHLRQVRQSRAVAT